MSDTDNNQEKDESILLGLTPVATSKRIFKQDPSKARTKDIREKVFELERQGEWIVHRVPEPYAEIPTKYGRLKKIPLEMTWHHKPVGQ